MSRFKSVVVAAAIAVTAPLAAASPASAAASYFNPAQFSANHDSNSWYRTLQFTNQGWCDGAGYKATLDPDTRISRIKNLFQNGCDSFRVQGRSGNWSSYLCVGYVNSNADWNDYARAVIVFNSSAC